MYFNLFLVLVFEKFISRLLSISDIGNNQSRKKNYLISGFNEHFWVCFLPFLVTESDFFNPVLSLSPL